MEGYARLKSSAQVALLLSSIGGHSVQLKSWYLGRVSDHPYGVYLTGVTTFAIILQFFTGCLILFVAKMSLKEKDGKRQKKLPPDAPIDEPVDALARNTVKANLIVTLLLFAISFLDVVISGTMLGSNEQLPAVAPQTAAPI